MSNSTVDARLSLILMLWEKVSENKRNWISLTEMNRHTLSAPLSRVLLQCSAWKVIMFRWTTDFRTDKQESKTRHTHSVIPYISQLWYKRERRLFNYSHRGENENTITTLIFAVLRFMHHGDQVILESNAWRCFCSKIHDLSLMVSGWMYYAFCIQAKPVKVMKGFLRWHF